MEEESVEEEGYCYVNVPDECYQCGLLVLETNVQTETTWKVSVFNLLGIEISRGVFSENVQDSEVVKYRKTKP